jgi:hypothetical protein
MKTPWSLVRIIPVLALVFLCAALVSAAPTIKKKQEKAPTFGEIAKDPQNWVEKKVEAGQDVYLSANYLFQVMKLRSQKILTSYEAERLYPTLIEAMDAVKAIGPTGQALVFVEMARNLLQPGAKTDPSVSEEVEKRITAFNEDPQNTPRGQYVETEELKRYFRAVQFLTKATFDVKVNHQWFAKRLYMLFPFEAAVELLNALASPENQEVLDKVNQVHLFYDRLVGPPDLPSFHDLLGNERQLTPEAVLAYAKETGRPKINVEMGVGIQFLGERFSYHQLVIENLSRTFLAPDKTVTRKKAFDVLRFQNVLFGYKRPNPQVEGLMSVKPNSSAPGSSYYDLCLAAVTKLPIKENDPYLTNTAATCLTALAEQTILVTKQTTLVPKGLGPPQPRKRVVNIYVQPEITDFLDLLSKAEQEFFRSCEAQPATRFYDILKELSKTGQPIKSDSDEGLEVLHVASSLPLDPTVTADVFYYSGMTDKGFLQWAIAPFEVEYGGKGKGLEMVFFEGWHDTLDKKAKTPMNNEIWKKLIADKGAKYKKFKPIVEVKGTRSK